MNDRGFGKRLALELAHWQEQGWVSVAGRQAILADLAERQTKPAWASVFALVGALLLGVGVITWFAAHWDEMRKLTKLVLIVVALAGSHLAYGLCLARAQLPKLAQGLALLTVLFFGAAIMLVGQIYHIDAHFPDGIALWAAAGLLTAWLFAAQPALVASIALAAVWTWCEQFDYQQMNWPLAGYLALAALLLAAKDWTLAARAYGVLFILWLIGWHAQPWLGELWQAQAHMRLFALQILALAALWALCQASEHAFARALRGGFLLAALAGIFVLSFPDFARHARVAAGVPAAWLVALAGCAAFYALAIFRLARASKLAVSRLRAGIVLAAAIAALLAVEVIAPRTNGVPALFWNALFLALIYWLGDLGMRAGDRVLVNRAFVGFALWIIARYFDTFWSLFDRALFFMAGGVLLLAGGAWLERKRRQVLRGVAARGQS